MTTPLQRNGAQLRWGMVATLVASLVASACGSGSKRKVVDSRSALDLTTLSLAADSGGDQSVQPLVTYETEVIFSVIDSNGYAVPKIPVAFKLFDATDLAGEKPTEEQIATAWESDAVVVGTPSEATTALIAARTAEEMTGKIVSAGEVSDAAGLVKLQISAPAVHRRIIAVVGRIVKDGEIQGSAGALLLKSDDYGPATRFEVATTNANAEKAGTSFQISIIARDSSGFVAEDFSGSHTLALSHDAEASWAGFVPTMPAASVNCTFSAGTCQLGSGPYTLTKATETSISVSEAALSLTGEAAIAVSTDSTTQHVVLASKAGGPAASAAAITEVANAGGSRTYSLDFTADMDTLDAYPALVDAGGNYLSTPASAAWVITGPLDSVKSDLGANGKNFAPSAAGTGTFTVTVGTLVGNVDYNLKHGNLDQLQLATNLVGNAVAGTAFDIVLTAQDRKGNTVLTVEGAKEIAWTVTGNSATVEDHDIALPADGPLTFTAGVAPAVQVTNFNALADIDITAEITDGTVVVDGSTGTIDTDPNTAHHVGVAGPATAETTWNHSMTFSATFTCRDEWGNTTSGCPNDIQLEVRTAGNAPVGILEGTGASVGTLDLSTATPLVINDLAFNIGGDYRIYGYSTSTPAFSSTDDSSPIIEFEGSLLNIVKFRIDYDSALPTMAGVPVDVTVYALGSGDATITDIDDQLNAGTYTWGAGAGIAPQAALDATNPVFPAGVGGLTFTAGVATATFTAYRAETIVDNTPLFTLTAGSNTWTGYTNGDHDIVANVPAEFVTADPGTQTAGTSFGLTIDILDAYENPTDGFGTDGDCDVDRLTVSVVTPGEADGRGEFGGSSTAFSDVTGVAPFGDRFLPTGIVIYRTGSINLSLEGCDGVTDSITVTVEADDAANVYFNRVDASTEWATPADAPPGLTELECPNSGIYSDSDTACPTLYSFVYDQYGNRLASDQCTWSYTDQTAGAGGGDAAPTYAAGPASSNAVSATNFINGYLQCDPGTGAAGEINLFGGVSRVAVSSNVSGSPLLAGNDNFTLTQIELFRHRGLAGEEALVLSSSQSFDVGVTSDTTSTLGIASPLSLTFSTGGIHGPGATGTTTLDFTVHESDVTPTSTPVNTLPGSRTVSVEVFGKTGTVTNIDIVPNQPATMTIDVNGGSAATAGTAFDATVTIEDAFGNRTDGKGAGAGIRAAWASTKDCTVGSGLLDISGGSASDERYDSDASTAAVTPDDTAPGAEDSADYGVFTVTGITLYKKMVSETLYFDACGLAQESESIQVNPGAAHNVYFNNVDATTEWATPTDAAPGLTEIECTNSGAYTSAAVSCPSIYSFVYDQWGNHLDSDNCSWSYADLTAGGDGGSATLTFTAGPVAQNTPSAANFVNGNLTCNPGTGTAGVINIFGGVSRIEVSSSYPGTPIIAGNNNLIVTQIDLFRHRGAGGEEAVSFASATNIDVGITTDSTTTLGVVSPVNLSFDTDGIHGVGATGTTALDFTVHESDETPTSTPVNGLPGSRTLTVQVFGKTDTIDNIDVLPAEPASISIVLNGGSAATAGTAFNAVVTVRDAFNNRADGKGAGAGDRTAWTKDCTIAGGYLDISGGDDSVEQYDSDPETPAITPDDTAPGAEDSADYGTFSITGITLYKKKASETLYFDGCGIAQASANIQVNPGAAANVYFNNVDATTEWATITDPAPGLTEIECTNSGAYTSAAVSCPTIYAFLYDQWGNRRDSDNCSWSYADLTAGGAGGSATLTHAAGPVAQNTPSAANFVNGNLTCNPGTGTPGVINVFGGVARIDVASSYSGTPIIAGNNNFTVTQINLFRHRGAGGEETMSYASATNINVGITSNSTSTLGVAVPVSLSFDTGGVHGAGATGTTALDFTVHESSVTPTSVPVNTLPGARTVTVQVFGKTDTVTNIDILPAEPASVSIVLNGGSAATAGTAFNAVVTVRDAFNNRADGKGAGVGDRTAWTKDCTIVGGYLDISGGTTSTERYDSDPPTAAITPDDTAPGAEDSADYGRFTVTGITLYSKTASETLYFDGCGIAQASANIQVHPGPAYNVYFNNVNSTTQWATTTDPAPGLTEIECTNSGAYTSSAVTCPTIYSFLYDQWGNRRDSDNCNWSYADLTAGGAGGSATLTHAAGPIAQNTPSAANFVNGNLTCNAGTGTPGVINVFGGVARIDVASTYTGTPIIAANNNITVTQIDLFRHRGAGGEEAMSYASPTNINVGITSNSTSTLGVAVPVSLSFDTAGVHGAGATGTTALDFTVHESSVTPTSVPVNTLPGARTLTVQVFGKTDTVTNIDVLPAEPASLSIVLNGGSAATAGTAFNAVVTVRDAFNNRADGKGAGAGDRTTWTKDCTIAGGYLDITGGTDSVERYDSVAITNAITPDDTAPGAEDSADYGRFNVTGITLYYKIASETLAFTGCGIGPNNATITVNPAVANAVYFNNTDTPWPTPGDPAPGYTDHQCANSGAATSSNVTCPTVYAFAYDLWGNQLDNQNCTWSYSANAGAATVPTYTASGVRTSTPTATNFIDGNLRCTHGSAFSEVNIFGGISSIELTHDYTAPGPIAAALNNINISKIKLYRRHGGVTEDMTYSVGTSQTIAFSTTSLVPMNTTSCAAGPPYVHCMGQPASLSCTFNTDGECTTAYPFDMTRAEYADLGNGNRSITATIRGKTAQITNINIRPTSAFTVAVHPFGTAPTAKTAGTAFTQSLAIYDQFYNVTEESGCDDARMNVDFSTPGTPTSPGGWTGVATPPAYAGPTTTTNTPDGGHFTSGNVTLYRSGSNTVRYVVEDVATADCTIPTSFVNVTYTVNPAGANVVYFDADGNRTDILSTDIPPKLTERYCTNNMASATDATVSCPIIYSFFWDAYGNQTSSNSCTTWSWVNNGSATTPSGFTAAAAVSKTISANTWVDGKLTCTQNGNSSEILVYGGISEIDVTYTETANSSLAVVAELDNLNLTSLKASMRKDGVKTDINIAGSRPIDINHTLTVVNGGLGQTDPFNCTFDSTGLCSTAFAFDLLDAQQNKNFTLRLYSATYALTDVDVAPNDEFELRMTAGGLAKMAGVGFDVTVTAYDAFGNVATGFHNENVDLTFAWLNTTATNADGAGDNQAAETTAAAATWTFLNGVATSTGSPFVLYNESDVGIALDITAYSHASTLDIDTNLTGFTVDHNTIVGYTKIHDVSTADTPWSDEITTHSMTTDDTKQLWAHGYDAWGNYISLVTGNWTASNELSGRLGAATGVNTITVDPNAVTATTSVVTFDHGSATDDSTGDFTVNPGALSHFVVEFVGVASPVTAGQEFAVRVTAKDAEQNTKLDHDGSQPINWLWNNASNAPDSTAPKKPSDGNFNFTDGVYESAATAFALYNATTSNATLSVNDGSGHSGTTVATLAVDSAIPAELRLDNITAKTAGVPFSVTARVLDAYENPVEASCGTDMSVTDPGGNTSPGGHGGSATGPNLPAGLVAEDSTGVYTTDGGDQITLYKEGINNLTFTACTGNLQVGGNVTVNPAAVNAIYLSTTNSAPASHLTTVGCSEGTTVSCAPLYAFAWDAYGNEIDDGAFQCASWSYANDNANPYDSPNPSLSNVANAHSTQLTGSTWHVEGTITCTAGVTADTNVSLTRVEKSYSMSCGSWSCQADDAPVATCTVTNNTGYDFSATNWTNFVGDDSACTGGVNTGGSCNITYEGTEGQASGSISVTSTADAGVASFVSLSHPAATQVQAGAVAPNCTDVISTNVGGWSCNNGNGRIAVTLTNNNGTQAANVSASMPSFSPAGNFTIATSNCAGNTIAAGGGTCVDTLENPSSGESTSADYDFASYFQSVGANIPASPDCRQTVSVGSIVTAACSEPGGSKSVTYTLTNNNTLNSVTVGTITVNDAAPAVGAVGGNNCTTIAPGGNCQFTVDYTDTPAVNNTDISVDLTDGYFTDISIDTSMGDNSCP